MITPHTTAEAFRSFIHAGFTVSLAGVEPISLELVEVADLGPAHAPDCRRPFALYFLGPHSNQYLGQGTYSLEHPTGGSMDIFIVPLGPLAGRMRYEAIFS